MHQKKTEKKIKDNKLDKDFEFAEESKKESSDNWISGMIWWMLGLADLQIPILKEVLREIIEK